MKTRLLKKLRKEAKRYIHLYPCGFEESYNQCFSHSLTDVEIHMVCVGNNVIKKCETKDYHEDYHVIIDGVDFFYCIVNALSWGWSGRCRLDKAKKILNTLRHEYILQECERIRKERLFKNNKKEYRNFKKYLELL